MADKPIKIPGPDHPISVEANPSRMFSDFRRERIIFRDLPNPLAEEAQRRNEWCAF